MSQGRPSQTSLCLSVRGGITAGSELGKNDAKKVPLLSRGTRLAGWRTVMARQLMTLQLEFDWALGERLECVAEKVGGSGL